MKLSRRKFQPNLLASTGRTAHEAGTLISLPEFWLPGSVGGADIGREIHVAAAAGS